MDLDSGVPGVGAEAGSDGDAQVFVARPVGLEHLGVTGATRRIVGLSAANGSVLAAFQNGDVVRWYPIEDEASPIDFGRDRCNDIGRVFLEPKGFHSLVTNSGGDSWYLNFQSNQAKVLPKLKGHVIEAVSWDPDSTATSTKDIIVGTIGGQILHVVIEGKERVVRPLFTFDLGYRVPICGVQRERSVSAADGSERTILFVAAACGVYAFVGPSLETLFQKYQGESAVVRALVYEVPRDSPHGDLVIDSACVGPPSQKVLFWLTGVGVLAAAIKNPIEADNAVLEWPPGLIPFPRSPKAQAQSRSGGSLVSSLLPPPPPPAPLSMALSKYHIIFVFEDRWTVVSRITHELVQQQEWSSASYGGLRSVSCDVHGEKLWLCSEKHMFELIADAEDRNVWTLLLRLEQFDDAIAACKRAEHCARVLAAHADWLFRKGRLVEAARKFAEATTVPFEHVALRFLGANNKAALLEYLRCRLRQRRSDDKVTRALLGVWAVEISLAHLNELRLRAQGAKGRAALDAERARLHELLKDCRDLDVHPTVYHVLQSHGWLEELAIFAESRRDYTTVILHHVSRRDCAGAIRKLADFSTAGTGEDLVCRFAPVLFGAEPHEFVSLLLRQQLDGVDPLSVLPALYSPRASTEHRNEAIRYLEHAVRHHPEFMGQAPEGSSEGDAAGPAAGEGAGAEGGKALRGGRLSLDSDLVSGVEEAAGGGARSFEQGGWASGTAVLNALTVLYACDCANAPEAGAAVGDEAAAGGAAGEAEATLLRFLAAQEGNQLLDPRFALRVCNERGLSRAVVLLYGIMGLHEEAVNAALRHGDVALAKHNACKPTDRRLRQRLWLRIVENQAASGDVQKITGLIRESQELSVRDVLPYMSDLMTIDAFQEEICECLDSYEGQILTLRQEMDDHRRALQAFKEDLKHAEERCVVISQDQACEICGVAALRERFYVFACKHCFHEACLRALVLPTLGAEPRARLMELEETRVRHQAVQAGGSSAAAPAVPLAEVEDELDSILADDCPLCGHLMIQTIRRPFVDPCEDAEVESWKIS